MNNQNNKYHPTILLGGLIAANLAVMQSLIGLDRTNILQDIALTAFAIAIPLSGFAFFLCVFIPAKNAIRQEHIYNITWNISLLSTAIGIDVAFWDTSIVSGITFVISIIYIIIGVIISFWDDFND
jgi:hypothetical protein